MSKYADIIERLEKAEGPDRLIDVLVGYAADYVVEDISLRERMDRHGVEYMLEKVDRGFNSIWPLLPRYTASIDAAIALVERMLPGWNNSSIRTGDNEFAAYVWKGNAPHQKEYLCEGSPSRCGAILLALFRVLDAQETSE